MQLRTSFLVLPLLLLSGCGGSEPSPKAAPGGGQPLPPEGANGPSAAAPVEFVLEGNDQMQYDKRELKVKAGQRVKVTLKNVGKIPKVAMGHNFVLLRKGVTLADFSPKVLPPEGKIENDFLPEAARGDVLVHTKILGPGESDSVEFTAPGLPGELVYLCTFVGHAALMNGKIVVQ
ncbi:MAG: plastocyanin/azurin family copper-binding protein [Planctomycetota bacterium]